MPSKVYKRRFNFVNGRSNKFWEVEVIDTVLVTRWGRIGTTGQGMTENYVSNASALLGADRKCNEKLSNGYKEQKEPIQDLSPTLSELPLRNVIGDSPRGSDKLAAEALMNFFNDRKPASRVAQLPRSAKPPAKPKGKKKTLPTGEPSSPMPVAPKPMRKVRI